jgi:hypothetical protein
MVYMGAEERKKMVSAYELELLKPTFILHA